jgi:hypothetical protein
MPKKVLARNEAKYLKRGENGTKNKAELESSWKGTNSVNFSLRQLTETHKYFVTITN